MIRAPGTSAEIGASPCGSSAAMPSQTCAREGRGGDRDPDVAERVTAQGRGDPARRELRHESQADDHAVPEEVRPAPERKLPGDDARDPERAHQADAEIQHQHHAEGDQEERAPARLVGCARHAAGDHAAKAELARDDVRVLVRGVLEHAERARGDQCRGQEPEEGPERDAACDQAAGPLPVELDRLDGRCEQRVRPSLFLDAPERGGAPLALLLQAQHRLPHPWHQIASPLLMREASVRAIRTMLGVAWGRARIAATQARPAGPTRGRAPSPS